MNPLAYYTIALLGCLWPSLIEKGETMYQTIWQTLRRMTPKGGTFTTAGIPYRHPASYIADTWFSKSRKHFTDIEPQACQFLNQAVRNTDKVLIVGAGWGITTAIAAQKTTRTLYVIDPEMGEIGGWGLKSAMESARLNGALIFPIQMAVGQDQAQDIELIATIQPTVMEIDCEGAETAFLQALKQTTIRPREIIIETHKTHNQVLMLLYEMQYDIVARIQLGGELELENIHAKRREKTNY